MDNNNQAAGPADLRRSPVRGDGGEQVAASISLVQREPLSQLLENGNSRHGEAANTGASACVEGTGPTTWSTVVRARLNEEIDASTHMVSLLGSRMTLLSGRISTIVRLAYQDLVERLSMKRDSEAYRLATEDEAISYADQ